MAFQRANFDLEVQAFGVDAVVARLRQLDKNARDEARKGMVKLSRDLANIIRRAGKADSRQSARAATTVRARTGLTPGVLVGPHPLLFGSEFGANGRYGWYAAERYKDSVGRQFRPHVAGGSYWFFKTAKEQEPRVNAAAKEIADAVIRDWGS